MRREHIVRKNIDYTGILYATGCMYTHTHTCTRVHAHTHTHTHTHAHTQRLVFINFHIQLSIVGLQILQ